MTLSAAPVPSANAERLATETPAADVASHHLTVFADGDDSPSFKDFLDIINPLQHIPIVNTIYRELTGDEPGALARVAGGALYGGVIGMALEATDAIIDDETGKDVGEHIWAFLTGDDSEPGASDGTKVAQDSVQPTAAATPQSAGPQSAGPQLSGPQLSGTNQQAAPEIAVLSSAGEAAQPPSLTGAGMRPTVIKESLAPTPAAAVTVANAPPPPLPAQGQIKMPERMAQSVPTPETSASETGTSETGAKPLTRGFMPVPPRLSTPIAPMPPMHIPITTSSQNSNIPVTGRPIPNTNLNRDAFVPPIPVASTVPQPVNSQTSLTAQQIALQNQPLPSSPTAPSQWFPSTMASALDKYEQMNKLGRAPTSTAKASAAKAANTQMADTQTANIPSAYPQSTNAAASESITFAP